MDRSIRFLWDSDDIKITRKKEICGLRSSKEEQREEMKKRKRARLQGQRRLAREK